MLSAPSCPRRLSQDRWSETQQAAPQFSGAGISTDVSKHRSQGPSTRRSSPSAYVFEQRASLLRVCKSRLSSRNHSLGCPQRLSLLRRPITSSQPQSLVRWPPPNSRGGLFDPMHGVSLCP